MNEHAPARDSNHASQDRSVDSQNERAHMSILTSVVRVSFTRYRLFHHFRNNQSKAGEVLSGTLTSHWLTEQVLSVGLYNRV